MRHTFFGIDHCSLNNLNKASLIFLNVSNHYKTSSNLTSVDHTHFTFWQQDDLIG